MRLRHLFTGLLLAALTLQPIADARNPRGGAQPASGTFTKLAYTGTLTTSGNQFSNGTTTGLLIGANSSGFEAVAVNGYSPADPFGSQAGLVGGPNYAAMGGSAWKMNFLRLPFNEASMMQRVTWDANNQVNVTDPGGNYRTAYAAAITNAHAAGMYVSIDMHWTMAGGGTPLLQDVMANTENSLSTWQYIANTWGSPNGTSADPGVVFELFNEPNLPGQGGAIQGPTGTIGAGSSTTAIVDTTPQTWATNMWAGVTVKNNSTGQTAVVTSNTASALVVPTMSSGNTAGQTYTFTGVPSPYSQVIAQGGTGTRVNYAANGGAFNQTKILQLSAAPTVNTFFPGDTITQGGTSAKVYGYDAVNHKLFYDGAVSGFTTGAVTKTAGVTSPPMIGRSATPHTVTTGYPAANLNSTNYGAQWRSGVGTITSGNPAWADLDLSSVVTTATRTIMVTWFNDATYFDPPQSSGGQPYYNNPQNYTIQMNTASGTPTTGWTTVATVNGWFLNSNIHLISMGGGSSIGGTYWKNLRMNVTSILGSTGNTDVNMKMEAFDVTNGLQGAILGIGDSITAMVFQHKNAAGSFGDVANGFGGYYAANIPLLVDAGIPGTSASSAAISYPNLLTSTNPAISLSNLIPSFPGQFVTVNLGVNDEAGGTGNISAYTTGMTSVVNLITGAGKLAIIPTITWNTSYPDATTQAYNTAITGTLQALPGVLAGPDLYKYTKGYNASVTAGTNSTTQATDTTQNWAPNGYVSCTYTNTTTTGTATVTSNTSTTLTFSGGMSVGTNTAGNGYNLNCQGLITSAGCGGGDGLHPNCQGQINYMRVWAWWASQNLSNAATATVSNATGTFGIAGFQQIINAIRATGATNTILVGMNDYSNRVQDWLANLVTDPRPAGFVGTWNSHIAAARHPYLYGEAIQAATIATAGTGYKGITGTVTSGTSGNPGTLVDTSQTWTTNQWAGSYAYSANSPYVVVSNTACPGTCTLSITAPGGAATWGPPSGTYYLGDLIKLPQTLSSTYFPAWFLVNGVSGGAITSFYSQMPTVDPTGQGQGRGGIYLAFNASGSILPTNPLPQASTSGSGTGATFNASSYGFTTAAQFGGPDSNPTSRTYESAILAAGIPVIYTEFGDWSQTGATQAPWTTDLTTWADTAGISTCPWTWDTFGYNYKFNSLITNSAGTASPGFGTVFQAYSVNHLALPLLPLFAPVRGRHRRRTVRRDRAVA